MEANFNFSNKMIFGVRMVDNVRWHGWMLKEIYSKKGTTTDDGTLVKVLFYYIMWQLRVSAGLSSFNEENYYDNIVHTIALLVFRVSGES